jgi:hypothetical protein
MNSTLRIPLLLILILQVCSIKSQNYCEQPAKLPETGIPGKSNPNLTKKKP